MKIPFFKRRKADPPPPKYEYSPATIWGPRIPVYGIRPDWLPSDQAIDWKWSTGGWSTDEVYLPQGQPSRGVMIENGICYIRLPEGHALYRDERVLQQMSDMSQYEAVDIVWGTSAVSAPVCERVSIPDHLTLSEVRTYLSNKYNREALCFTIILKTNTVYRRT